MEARVVFVSPNPILEELVALVPDPGDRAISEGSYGYAIHVLCDHPDPAQLRDRLRQAADTVAVAVITGALVHSSAGLVLCDVDSTFTTTEAIDLIAVHAGREAEVSAITERAMHGELDFSESLRERVAAVAGVPTSVLTEVGDEMTLSPGARELVAAAHAAGARIGLTSGGFNQLVGPLAEREGLDFWSANQLETAVRDGVEVLTGRVTGTIVDRAQKARDLLRFAAETGVDPALAVAVGDGANDLDMMATAGLGVAYCGKPLTAQTADVALNFPRLDAVIPIALER